MKTFFAPEQLLHMPLVELNRGTLVAPFEHAGRAKGVVEALTAAKFGPLDVPLHYDDALYCRVHDADFVHFLKGAHAEWRALGREGDALPMCWPGRGTSTLATPASLDGRLGYYAFDIMTPITPGSWDATSRAADTAIAGAEWLVRGDSRAAFSLCRPPGHHAGINTYGGYCFLNSAAIAAQYLRDHGAAKVAVFDVDYHHGNGTQEIFYDRADVAYVSIHADPQTDFPYYTGFKDERGEGIGIGHNHNFPLPRGTNWSSWENAFDAAKQAIDHFAPDALVISLGVDSFVDDPLSHFSFEAGDFTKLGRRLNALGYPTVIVFEGGYAVEEIGENVLNVLTGFEMS